MPKKIRIFYNNDFIEKDSKVIFIFEVFMNLNYNYDDPDSFRYANLKSNIFDYYEFVNDINADYFVFPHDNFEDPLIINKLNNFHSFCKSLNKPLYVFYNNDRNLILNLDNILLFKTSFNKSKASFHDYSFPAFSIDFINYYQNKSIFYLTDNSRLSISYCGYVDYLDGDKYIYIIYNILKNTYRKIFFKINSNSNHKYNIGIVYRGIIIRNLIRNSNISFNFIRRDGFWAKGLNKNDARKEYFENISNNLMALVVRGAGNFSYRFYEVLSAGRIPVILDTDLPLPFSDSINYHEFCLFINEKEINEFDKILVKLFMTKSKEDLFNMQKKAREVFEIYFEPLNYMRLVLK